MTNPDITEWVPVETQDITARIRVDHGALHLDRLTWAYLSAAQWEALKAEGDRLLAGARGRKMLALAVEAGKSGELAGLSRCFGFPDDMQPVEEWTDGQWEHVARVLRSLPSDGFGILRDLWDAAGKELSGGQ